MSRFEVCGDAASGFGVSDSATSRWSMPLDLSEAEAAELAADLNARCDSYQRGPEAVRWCKPAVPVAARRWKPAGTIDVWIRDRGEWYGRVCDDTGRVRWYPADDLRPAGDPPVEKAS
ncbi:hypothetical protein ACGFIF_31330 [Kribbella sp. NPDC049174]|uniref:hypothetical protein n=1 Tax=Kribbella sp. NPDC049174 TaxID=3364112 RepID=UPI003713FD4E